MQLVECCGDFKRFVAHVHDIAYYAALNKYKATDFNAFSFCPFCGEKAKFIEVSNLPENKL